LKCLIERPNRISGIKHNKSVFSKKTQRSKGLLTCAQHNNFMIITELFNQYKIYKVYANTVQNLDKSYCFKFFYKRQEMDCML